MTVANPVHLANCGLPGIDAVPNGMHACYFYSNRDDLIAALVPFFVTGLRENERCIWITAPPLPANEAIEALRAAWPSVDHAIASGQLRLLDFNRWYANSGRLKSIDLVQSWLNEEEAALADGYEGLRITGNMSFLERGDWPAFMEYEQAVTAGFNGRRIVALCSYALEQCDEHRVGDVVHAHRSAVERAGAAFQMVATPKASALQRKATGRCHTEQPDLRLLLDAAAEGLCAIDREGAITLCNAAFLRMTGYARMEEVVGQDFGRLIRNPDANGAPDARSHCPVLKAARTGNHAHVDDAVFHRADGTSFPVEHWARPILREGRIEGAVCTVMDITERKQAEAQQQVLNRELAHRVKNTLTVVQAIVSQTLRSTADPKAAVQAVNARLFALRDADEMLMSAQSDGAPLTDVIGRGLAVYGADNPRIQVAGVSWDVGPRTAVSLTMALHELCTNAVKYGALSNDSGNVDLVCSVDQEVADPKLRLRWKERGGPPVTVPERTGFGSTIIQQYCKSVLGAEFALLFEPDGVEWTLDVPLESSRQ